MRIYSLRMQHSVQATRSTVELQTGSVCNVPKTQMRDEVIYLVVIFEDNKSQIVGEGTLEIQQWRYRL